MLLEAIAACAREVLAEVDPTRVAGVGITNQRETIVVWERATGLPIANAIVWQDTRTADRCAELVAAGAETRVRESDGLADPALLLGHEACPAARNGSRSTRPGRARKSSPAGTIECWLAWNLTGGSDGGVHVSDVTNASRTLLL